MGVVCQFSLRAPLWLVQMQYVVPITLKVGQKYVLDDFAINTCTQNEILVARILQSRLGWQNSVFYGLIAENDTQNTQQATFFCIISSH